jgi:16S rRNA (cytosine967-C5)-methyltransferase
MREAGATVEGGHPQPSGSPRGVALAALGRVEQDGAWANLLLPGLLAGSGLSTRDRAAVTDLVNGSLRLRGALDAAIAPLSRQPLERLQPLVRNGLRLGAYELLFAGTAPHAALAEVVGAVRRAGNQGQAGYVNAVLRRLTASPPRWPDPARDPVGWATTAGSHPPWIVAEALERLGPEGMVRLVEADNARPAVTLRATPGRVGRDELLAELAAAGVEATPSELSPDCVVLARGDPGELAAVRGGRAVVQDAAAALVAPALGARPGDLVLDSAAGPGGKGAQLAALGARVLAVELHPARARLVRETAARLGQGARLLAVAGDGTRPPLADGSADGALVDAPCSNLGSLRRRPEARWRHGPGEVPALAELQRRMLAAAARAVRPGGAVLYAVCTWTLAETDRVVDAVLADHPELEPAPLGGPLGPAPRRQLWPHLEGGDGMFVARLVRRGRA